MKSHANCVFRADASPQIGSGHIIRCLALAGEIKKQGGSTLFITCPAVSPSLQNMIRKQGHSLHMLRDDVPMMGDAEQTLKVIQSENEVDWLIVDHYALDAHWERKMRPKL